MPNVTVEIAAIEVSDNQETCLITYALGSCIAVMVHDPTKKIGGMIHFMLPQSSISPEKALERPGMFADTGIPELFQRMYRQSCQKKDLIVKVAGGGIINDGKGTFDIGRRNYTMLRKMFWKAGVVIAAEHVGGALSRTARLYVGTGRVTIRVPGGEEVDL